MTPLEQALLLGLGEQQKRSSAKDEVGLLLGHQVWQPVTQRIAVLQRCKNIHEGPFIAVGLKTWRDCRYGPGRSPPSRMPCLHSPCLPSRSAWQPGSAGQGFFPKCTSARGLGHGCTCERMWNI